jgi:hypothetical protein
LIFQILDFLFGNHLPGGPDLKAVSGASTCMRLSLADAAFSNNTTTGI